MTDQYIITKEKLDRLMEFVHKLGAAEEGFKIGDDVRSHPYNSQSERDKVLEALKKDLQTRFVSSSNQWSKGRNSGLLECCNIIDEELRQEGKDGE